MANCICVVYIIHVIYDPIFLMSVMVDLCCHFIHIVKFHSCVNIIHVMRINHMVVKFINLLVSSMEKIHPTHLCNQFHLYGRDIYHSMSEIYPCGHNFCACQLYPNSSFPSILSNVMHVLNLVS